MIGISTLVLPTMLLRILIFFLPPHLPLSIHLLASLSVMVAVVWTSLGPLPRWVPGPTTRWAPGTTRLALHGT
jgi:hypothetical protein